MTSKRRQARADRMRYEEMIGEAAAERKAKAEAEKQRKAEAKKLQKAITKKVKQAKKEEARLKRMAARDKKRKR